MIEVENLTKRYGHKRVVDRVSFSVRPGTVTGFLGPNGAGKTTTMRMILGLARPDGGRALVDGVAITALPAPAAQVGALLSAEWFQHNMTARANLRAVAATNGIDDARVNQCLRLVGLDSVADRRVKTFSLGMKQRLGIAQALLGDPGTLLFDEPVNGLDPEGVHWLRGLLRGLAAQGRAVLVSSHLLTEVAQTADHLVVIGKGRVIAQGATSDIVAGSTKRHTRVRTTDQDRFRHVCDVHGWKYEDIAGSDAVLVEAASPDEIGRAAAQANLAILELAEQRASLEDAFLRLTTTSQEYRTTQSTQEGER